MKKKSPYYSGSILSSFLFAFLAASLLLAGGGGVQRRCPTTALLCDASRMTPAAATATATAEDGGGGGNELAIELPTNDNELGGGGGGGGGRLLGRFVDWGLARLEDAIRGGDVRSVSDLIAAFAIKCDAILSTMVRSMIEVAMPYEKLRNDEAGRLARFDVDFKDLVALRNKIERRCLRVRTPEDRSVCIDRGVEIRDRIYELRDRRAKSADAIVRYDGMIEWCASYNNWFC